MPKKPKSNNVILVEKLLGDAEFAEIESVVASGVDLKDASYSAVHTAMTKNRKDVIALFQGILLSEEGNERILEAIDKFLSEDAEAASEPPLKTKKKKIRCAKDGCKFSKTLYMFDCRCRKRYCATHLPSESHECTFDYREAGKLELEAKNPLVVRDKIDNRL